VGRGGVVLDFLYLVSGHTVTRLDASFVEFVSFSFFGPSPLVNP
jgi:hypothetical protein